MGRHHRRAPRWRWLARITAALGITTAPMTLAGAALASPPGVADAVRVCESGDRNIEHGGDAGGASTASGYFQFTNPTWKHFGGTEFAPRAIGATKAEQTTVFERAYAANGLRDWEASRPCWGSKIGKYESGQESPRHAAPTRERHLALDLAADSPADEVVVHKGDTLTKIATAHHTTWRRIYAANRDVVGSNPNWIYPGERLQV